MSINVLAVCGAANKNRNTAAMLKSAFDGAMSVPGEVRSFLERYFFPGITYNKDRVPTYPKRTKVGWVLTMNAPGEVYKDFFAGLVGLTGRIIGDSDHVIAYHTQQFEDYSKYAATMFDVEMMKRRHIEQFPKDCEAAFEMGKRLSESVSG